MTRSLFFSLLLLIAPAAGWAQTELSGPVEESYSGTVAVSGGVLVGAIFGLSTAVADPRDIKVNASGLSLSRELCLSSRTQDGVYWSRASFNIPRDNTGIFSVSPEGGWKYLQELSGYDRTEFAALARLSDSCDMDPSSSILPIQYGTSRTTLTFMVNSQRAFDVSAVLNENAGENVLGSCERQRSAARRSTAFNFLCRFDLQEDYGPGLYELTINRKTRIGSRSNSYTVLLPE